MLARLSVAAVFRDLDQGTLRVNQFLKALFILDLSVDHDRDLVVLLACLAARAQAGAHQLLGNALKPIKSFFRSHHGLIKISQPPYKSHAILVVTYHCLDVANVDDKLREALIKYFDA